MGKPIAVLVLCVASLTVVAASSSWAAEWGDLSGRFVYDGVPPARATINTNVNVVLQDERLLVGVDGGIANVVIYVHTPGIEIHPDLAKNASPIVALENKANRLVPHIVPIWLDRQKLLLRNTDVVGYNLNLQPLGEVGINPLLVPGAEVEHLFGRQQTLPQTVTCNIRPWICGYVLPRNNPYAAASDERGRFKLPKLPAGEWEFQVWHEQVGYVRTAQWPLGRFKHTIRAADNDLGDIKLAPALFKQR